MELLNIWPFRSSAQSRFEALIGPYVKRLYRLAYRFTGNRDDAEDLVQDLLVKLYPRFEEMQKIELLSPWLEKVLYRIFIDEIRRKQRSPVDFMGDEDTFYSTHESHLPGPLDEANNELTQELLNTALEKLSDDHRILIMLHDVEGYSLKEINHITGIPEGTIKSRLSRARNKLREMFHFMEPESLYSVNTGKR